MAEQADVDPAPVIAFVKTLKKRRLFDLYSDLVGCLGIVTIDDFTNKEKWDDGVKGFAAFVENRNLSTSHIDDLMKMSKKIPEWLTKSDWWWSRKQIQELITKNVNDHEKVQSQFSTSLDFT